VPKPELFSKTAYTPSLCCAERKQTRATCKPSSRRLHERAVRESEIQNIYQTFHLNNPHLYIFKTHLIGKNLNSKQIYLESNTKRPCFTLKFGNQNVMFPFVGNAQFLKYQIETSDILVCFRITSLVGDEKYKVFIKIYYM
jgi:hypothetical protein